jgi:hypothetical protein
LKAFSQVNPKASSGEQVIQDRIGLKFWLEENQCVAESYGDTSCFSLVFAWAEGVQLEVVFEPLEAKGISKSPAVGQQVAVEKRFFVLV